MHNTLRIVRNKEVNQSRGVTCYSGGFTHHLAQLVRFDNINESCCVRVPRVLQKITIYIASYEIIRVT